MKKIGGGGSGDGGGGVGVKKFHKQLLAKIWSILYVVLVRICFIY